MKPSKKIQKKLESRQNGYRAILENNKNNQGFNPKAYSIPGSRNPKK